MAATIDFANLGTLSPEDYAEQQALSKKQRLAQALLNQGMNNTPQGQMVSGRYVAPSIFQNLNQLAQAAAGKYLEKTGDEEALDYANRLRQRDQEEMKTGLELWRGREGQAPDKRAAADFFMTAKGSKAQALGAKLMEQEFKEPEWKETTLEMPNGIKVQGQYNKNAPNPMGTFIPFASSGNVEMAKAVHSGVAMPQIAGSGGTYGVNTQNPAPIGGIPLSVRNNNPGNMVGSNGQFQQFPTPQAGQDAMINDLNLKLNGQSPAYKARFGDAPVTPLTLAETWSPANAKGNSPQSTANYAKKIATDLGIDPNSPIPRDPATVSKLQGSMAQFEAGSYGNAMPAKPNKYALALPESGFSSEAEKQDWMKSARQPLTGESLNSVNGAMGTIRAADSYIDKLGKYDSKDIIANPNIRAEVQQATKNYLMFQKDAYKLGVLNKEDIPQLDAVVRDPTNIDNILVAKPALIKLAKFNQAFQRDNVIDAYQMSNKEIPTYVKNKLMKIDKEEESWLKTVQDNSKKENPNTVALTTQGQKPEPKAQDISQIKAALGPNYNPNKQYKVVGNKILEADR